MPPGHKDRQVRYDANLPPFHSFHPPATQSRNLFLQVSQFRAHNCTSSHLASVLLFLDYGISSSASGRPATPKRHVNTPINSHRRCQPRFLLSAFSAVLAAATSPHQHHTTLSVRASFPPSRAAPRKAFMTDNRISAVKARFQIQLHFRHPRLPVPSTSMSTASLFLLPVCGPPPSDCYTAISLISATSTTPIRYACCRTR